MVTGKYGVLDIINSGSAMEFDEKTIALMEKRIEALEKKVEDLIEESGEPRPNRRPPHY